MRKILLLVELLVQHLKKMVVIRQKPKNLELQLHENHECCK
uniref:Uncharacterized protein n=1 Tax=Arundo donax TaxID=35708 RepID=A0A0A8Z714_ARUDO